MKDYLEKRRAELKKRGNKGFTLMEMLIVVAIIAVLIAIAIPIFTSQLENSREATDAANIRSSYAEVVAAALTDPDNNHEATVTKVQQTAGWSNSAVAGGTIGGKAVSEIDGGGSGEVKITYTASTGVIKIGLVDASTSTLTS